MEINLSEIEARVLGSLIEKERTTPEYYPLTRNSLVSACNQKSNRSPVMALTETDVEHALETLRYSFRLVAQVTLAGSRSVRFRHELLSQYQFSDAETALLCELILRGAQTAGELRSHTQRMVNIETPVAVKSLLEGLMHWGEEAFVVKLPPRPGSREERYAHLFCGEPPCDEAETPSGDVRPASSAASEERIRELEERVASIDARLAALEQALT